MNSVKGNEMESQAASNGLQREVLFLRHCDMRLVTRIILLKEETIPLMAGRRRASEINKE